MKKIKGYSNYLITKDGVVYNSKTGRKRSNPLNAKGYETIVLCEKGKCNTKMVHRLVYEAFVSDIDGKMEINHIDGNKRNNHLDNLEAVTHQDNIIKAVETGLMKSGEEHYNSVSVIQLDPMTGNEIARYGSMRIAEKNTGVNSSSICLCVSGYRKSAGGYLWKKSIL